MLSNRSVRSAKTDLNALLDLMRPSVQADGGDLALIEADVETGVVEVQLRGACSSCAISSATLQGGVERILKGRLDWVTEVRGGVDETADPSRVRHSARVATFLVGDLSPPCEPRGSTSLRAGGLDLLCEPARLDTFEVNAMSICDCQVRT